MKKITSQRGFTLVELLVVMAIMAVLIGISVAGLGFAMRQARNTSRRSAMANLDRALEAYYSDNQVYPLDTDVIDMNDLIDEDGAILYQYLEGSWTAPPQTDVYYMSEDGVLYTVCVNQEQASGVKNWVCTGPGIGDTDYPEREEAQVGDEEICEACSGSCGLWDNTDNTFGTCSAQE